MPQTPVHKATDGAADGSRSVPPNINTQNHQQPQPATENLIDFGDDIMTPKAAMSQKSTQAASQNSNEASLIDLQPSITRQDTSTSSVDEFVDAEP